MKRWGLVVAAAILSGCGYIGAPLPPTLDIPLPATDFRAWQYGENIEVAFTLPDRTTENRELDTVESIELGIGDSASSLKVEKKIPGDAPGAKNAQIPVKDWIGKSLFLAVRATGPKGKVSGWSNTYTLNVIPPLATPADVKAANVLAGVSLTWTGQAPKYRIFRAEGDGGPMQLKDVDASPFVDESTSYGTRYRYTVQAIAADNQWSLISPPAEITPEDKFPPAVPTGLSAVPGTSSIELGWNRNTEDDLQGYNLYRSVDGGMFEKVASLIDSPVYSDRMIQSGKKYQYRVSAVDMARNESERSEPAEATAQ